MAESVCDVQTSVKTSLPHFCRPPILNLTLSLKSVPRPVNGWTQLGADLMPAPLCCAMRLRRVVWLCQQIYPLLTALHYICCSADVSVCSPLGELSVALMCCQVCKKPECCGLHKSSGTFQRQQPHKGCLGFNKGSRRVTTASQSLLEVLFPGVGLSVCWLFF